MLTSPATPTPTPSSSHNPNAAWMTHKRTPSSPLRISRLSQQIRPVSPALTTSALTRPPTPPRHASSPTAKGKALPSAPAVDKKTKSSARQSSPPRLRGSGTLLRSRSSREEFVNLIREGKRVLSPSKSARIKKGELSTPETNAVIVGSAGRTGSGRSVGALRKMFERSTG